MKKYVLFILVTMLLGITVGCRRPVPPNAFRVQTRGKFHLFGIPLPISVPNPGISINIKTSTMPGTAGTTGNLTEFNPGGAFVPTDIRGNLDAVNAVMPAPWNAKVAPNQSRCSAPASATIPFYATVGQTYKINCKFNIQISFLVQPGFVDLTDENSTGNPPLSATQIKTINGEALFLNAQNIKVLYYRHVGGEDYVLDGEKAVTSISPDGTSVDIPVPDYYSNHGYARYALILKEDGDNDVYLGHGELDVSYPLLVPTPTPTPCPPDLLCDNQV